MTHVLPVLAEVPSLSVEFLRVAVEAWEGGEVIDPTALAVEFAFTASPDDEPEAGDWAEGDWDTSNATYLARGLFGPGTDHPLTDGDWVAWCRVTATPERPVRAVGIVRIT
jgi:hypothetical protein